MRILVTGTAGFIGFQLSKSLLLDGFEVLGVDNISDYYDQGIKLARLEKLKKFKNFIFKKVDITNKSSIKKLFESFHPRKVVNLAAQPGIQYSIANPTKCINSNIFGFYNVIECCNKYGVEGFIYASSSSIYSEINNSSSEDDKIVDSSLSIYGVSKRSNELIASAYSHLYDLNTTGLRFFTVYGPWYRPDMAIPIFIKKINSGEKITIYNNGDIKKDFIYIDDIISGTRAAIDRNYSCEIFNLGTNNSVSLMEIISLIELELGLKAHIKYKPKRIGDIYHTCANIELSKEKIGFRPKTTIQEGIHKLINWHKDYYNV